MHVHDDDGQQQPHEDGAREGDVRPEDLLGLSHEAVQAGLDPPEGVDGGLAVGGRGGAAGARLQVQRERTEQGAQDQAQEVEGPGEQERRAQERVGVGVGAEDRACVRKTGNGAGCACQGRRAGNPGLGIRPGSATPPKTTSQGKFY